MKVLRVWLSIIVILFLSSVLLNGCSGSSGSSVLTFSPSTEVPIAPIGVTATPGNYQTTISWTADAGVTSYNIYWSTTPGVTTTNGTKITSVSSPFTQTGLTNGTTYYYVVTAVNSVGESAASLQVNSTPALPVPLDTTATPGIGQVIIAWDAVVGATSYNIYWSTTPGVSTSNGAKIPSDSNSFTQIGLTNGTTYYYVVTAVFATGGESAPSIEMSAIPSTSPTPAAPPGVTAISGNGQATIAWTAVNGATSYNIYWSTTAGVAPANGTNKITSVSSPFIQTGLTNGITYYFVVTALNGNGESTASAQVSAIPTVTPFIKATVFSLTGESNPFGFLQVVEIYTDNTLKTPITDATVSINGTTLNYDTINKRYSGTVIISAGSTVSLNVTIGSTTYNTTGIQYTSFPSIIAPATGATWQAGIANTITWTSGAPTTGATSYIIGLLDNNGNVTFPAGGSGLFSGLLNGSPGYTTYTIPANSLATKGSYQVFVGIGTTGIGFNNTGGIPIANTAAGSGLWLCGITNFVPITVQ